MVNTKKYLFLLFIANFTKGHIPKNNSDFIITYDGHSEVEEYNKKDKITPNIKTTYEPKLHTTSPPILYTEKDEVVFIPEVRGNEGYLKERDNTMSNLMSGRRTLDNVLNEPYVLETESPKHSDIFFVSGKNDENVEKEIVRERKPESYEKKKEKKHKLDCTHLDCNKTLASVCGARTEDNKIKYRLFLNECYFKKVNCAFSFENNRYTKVPKIKCVNVGAHYSDKPFVFKPAPPLTEKPKMDRFEETRRSFSSRRSKSISIDGSLCSHPCPSTCPHDYSPECAISATGNKHVFLNHCSLDYNSCFYNVVWHKRPLADCIGTQMADFRQNRGFISWLQRIGIVDAKGKLTT